MQNPCFFFGSFSNTRQPRNSILVCRVLGRRLFLHGRRISVYRACTLDEPARVVKPHRKHAQNTTGEVRGEFQRRRVCACCRSRKTLGASAAAGRFYPKRHPRLLPSLVETTITVDSHGRNQAACRIRGFVRRGPRVSSLAADDQSGRL